MKRSPFGTRTLVAVAFSCLVGAARAQTVTFFQLPNGANAASIVAGSNSDLWFSELANDGPGEHLFRMTTSGAVTEFSLPPAANCVGGIALGPDGALWFTAYSSTDWGCGTPVSGMIGRITEAGQRSEFPSPVAGSIATGPDGNLWFAELSANKIGRLTTSGALKEFDLPSQTSIRKMTVGADGALWCTTDSSSILRITMGGSIRAIPASCMPAGITAGPDGNLWFADTKGLIGRIDRSSFRVTRFPLPTSELYRWAGGIASGADGNLWFTRLFGGIGRITTTGFITEFPLSLSGFALDIAAGPDGALWFIEAESDKIGRIDVIRRRESDRLEIGTCVPDPHSLCLSGGRFLATATYRNGIGSGTATAVAISDATGFFTFDDADSAELVVKVLNACSFSPYIWVFVGGLTDQETTLSVTDTKTGVIRTYSNPLGTTFVTVTDTAAFSTCP
ncbi:MAG TPA: hypothetical protein VMR54_06375 [Thermoanaerobaculia bacterium]|nr:hypothetical protein [Thermoanaerobaculia bacterium]